MAPDKIKEGQLVMARLSAQVNGGLTVISDLLVDKPLLNLSRTVHVSLGDVKTTENVSDLFQFAKFVNISIHLSICKVLILYLDI